MCCVKNDSAFEFEMSLAHLETFGLKAKDSAQLDVQSERLRFLLDGLSLSGCKQVVYPCHSIKGLKP